MRKKILITGATGLVGRNLVIKALKKGYSINFLTTQKHKINSLKGCKGFYWDPFKGKIDLDAFKNTSYIVNLAGSSISNKWSKSYKIKIIESRVLSSQILYNSLVDINHKLKGIVSASAIGYYPSSLDMYYKESDIFNPENYLQKVVDKWESSVDELETYSNNTIKLRIGLVLSDQGGFLLKLLLPVKFGLGSSFGLGNQWQSWIHIEDLSNLILHGLEKNLNGVYNAVAPNPITQNELVTSLGKRINRPVFLPNIPKKIIETIFGDRSQLLLDSHRVSSDKILKSKFKFEFEKFEQAIKNLKLD